MSEKKYNWHKIAESEAAIPWQMNRLAIMEIAGKTITISEFEGKIYACAHKCPHAGGVMANGFVDATGNIVCLKPIFLLNSSVILNLGTASHLTLFRWQKNLVSLT